MTELEKAARMALEALMRSKNAVSEDYDLASCAYGSVDPDGHRYQDAKKAVKSVKEAITALRRALADQALDKMAENERELGIQMGADDPVCAMCQSTHGKWSWMCGRCLLIHDKQPRPQPAAPAIPDLTHDQWDAWQDKWQVMLGREALDDLRSMLAAAPEQKGNQS